jgi:hypothetical protein
MVDVIYLGCELVVAFSQQMRGCFRLSVSREHSLLVAADTCVSCEMREDEMRV